MTSSTWVPPARKIGEPKDIDAGVAYSERSSDLLLLAGGEAFFPVEQQTADSVERIAGLPAAAEGFLLGALPHLGEGLVGQPDDMEPVHCYCRVGEFAPNRPQIPPPRIQRCGFDSPAVFGGL